MNINQLLNRLGQEIGLSDLALDEMHLCTLRFDNKDIVVVEVPPHAKQVYLYSMLFTIPKNDKADFYERLLEANLFGKETGMASFSCNPKTGEVFLTRTLTLARLDYEHFALALEELLQCIEYWREQYEQGQLLSGKEQPINTNNIEGLGQQHPLDSSFV